MGEEMNERSFLAFNKDGSTVFLNLNQVCTVIAIGEDSNLTCTVRLSNSDTFTLDGEVAQALLARLAEPDVVLNEQPLDSPPSA